MFKTNKIETILGFLLLFVSFLTSAILPILGHFYFSTKDRKKLKINGELILKKQHEREEQFQIIQEQFSVNGKRQKILKLSEEELINRLHSRSLSATEVLEAYIAKAMQVTRKYNCVTEFIPEALEWAAELDSMEHVKGPLHGIPVSVKEHCNIKGMDSTMGYAQFLFRPAQDDAIIIKALKELGAIPFCKTNVPQSLFTYACGNSIYGETLNPLNTKLSPGGSSGGCAALISAGGSILGVGTDVGGSLRIPAHFCGISGMKPTALRMSKEGFRSSGAAMIPVSGINGFMAKNTKMLNYAYQALYASRILPTLDPNTVPIPWDDKMFNTERKLRFGYFTSHSYFPLMGDTEDVLLKAVDKLQSAGYEVVRFQMPDMDAVMELIFGFCFADQGEVFKNIWEGESVSDAAITTYWVCRLPLWFRKLIANVVEFKFGPMKLPVFHSPLTAKLLRGGEKTWKSSGLWSKLIERKAILDYIKSQWMTNNIDVLLSPAFPFPALPYSIPGKILQAVVYTMPWNLLDLPSGVVKFGNESGKRIDMYDNKGDFILRLAQQGAKQSIGMPIAVQVIGLPFQEEMVLNAMNIIESVR